MLLHMVLLVFVIDHRGCIEGKQKSPTEKAERWLAVFPTECRRHSNIWEAFYSNTCMVCVLLRHYRHGH